MSEPELKGDSEESKGTAENKSVRARLTAPAPEQNKPPDGSKIHLESSQRDVVPENKDTTKVTNITNIGQSETTEQKSSMSGVKEEEIKQLANTLATNIWTKQSPPAVAGAAEETTCALKDKKMPIPSAPQLNPLSGPTSYPIKPVLSLPAKKINTISDSLEKLEKSKTELDKERDENAIEMSAILAEPTTTREITEWSDDAEASGVPRGEGRAARAVRRFFCCGTVDAPSEDNISYTRTGSGI